MPTARADQKEATRQRLLTVARRHFEAHGFEGANLRAIGAEAGVSAASVIVHFTDKRELLHASLFADLEETINGALQGIGPGRLGNQLHALTEAVFAYYLRRPALSRTLLKEALFAQGPWAERFTAQVARVHGRVAELFVAAAARSKVRLQPDDALVFGAAWFSFYYFALLGWVQGANPQPLRMVDRMVAQHLRGILPRSEWRTR
ncbi:MAG: TetR/AcrR family transcriptional regulator [Myxococcota bacterium]|nr:TetR/AcrR family transcriptional regulator [Myxococcota bacterium]